MLSIILVSSILFVVTYVSGRLVLTLPGYFRHLCFTDVVFTGLAFVNSMLTIYSLYKPTGIITGLVLFTLSIVILLFWIIKLKPVIPKESHKILVFMLFFALVLGLIAADGPRNGDSIAYHIPAIKWIENYPVIPGLGNLHSRFAFNPNIFNLMAGFTFTGITGQAIYAVNTFFSLVFFYYLVGLFKKRQAMTIGLQLFYIVTGILSIQFMLLRLSSPTPDLIAGLLPVYIFLRYVEYHFLSKEVNSVQTWSFIWLLIILSTYVITVKLSAIFIMLLPMIMIWQHRGEINIKKILFIKLFALFLLIPWLYRNYYLSGYLVYPLNTLDIFTPDWKIPEWMVLREKAIIYNWAKWPVTGAEKVAGMSISEWLPFWYSHLQFFWKVFIPLTFLSPVIIAGLIRKNLSHQSTWIILRLWLVSFTGVIFWFVTAPDPRFGYPFIIVSTLALLLFIEMDPSTLKSKAARFTSVARIAFVIVCFAFPLKNAFQIRKSISSILVKALPEDTYEKDEFKRDVSKYSVDRIVVDPSTYPICNTTVEALVDQGKQNELALFFRGVSITDGFKIDKKYK